MALALWLNRLLPLVIDLSGSGSRLEGLDWPVLLFALALSILVGVLFGAVPALRASSGYLARDLAPGVRTAGARTGTRFRSTLVTSQVAISLVLLVGAGLLIRSFARLVGTNPGFSVQHLLTGEVQLPEARYAERSQRIHFFGGLREDLGAIPGVKAVGLISNLPIRNPRVDLPIWDSDHPPARPADRRLAFRRVVLPGYFGAIGIPLLSGRDLGKEDRENAPRTTVINERTAHALFPNRNPLGERVSMDMGGSQPATFEVVGVVGDVSLNSIDGDPPMTVYLSHQQFPDSTMRFAIRTEQKPESITLAVRNLVLARDRSIPVDNLVSMERIIGDSLAPQQTTTILLGLLAAMALLLAAVGLYGVIAYGVSQRTQEIGIRMALGAQRSDAVMLVVKQGSTLIGLGGAVGLLGSFALTRLLTNLLSWVTPNDPMTLAWVVLLLVVHGLGACWLPALRAAKIDPMVALRNP